MYVLLSATSTETMSTYAWWSLSNQISKLVFFSTPPAWTVFSAGRAAVGNVRSAYGIALYMRIYQLTLALVCPGMG